MLGQPALVTTHGRGDTQREAFFAEQRVAAVARADAPDGAGLGKVHDEATVRRQVAQGMQTGHPVAAARLDAVERDLTHAGHDAHIGHHVWTVGDFDADSGVG